VNRAVQGCAGRPPRRGRSARRPEPLSRRDSNVSNRARLRYGEEGRLQDTPTRSAVNGAVQGGFRTREGTLLPLGPLKQHPPLILPVQSGITPTFAALARSGAGLVGCLDFVRHSTEYV
jgi:hypothetical protein